MNNLTWHDLQWALQRTPKKVLEKLKANEKLFIAGGFIRSIVTNEDVNDIDLFCSSKTDGERIAKELVDGDESRIYRSDNAFTIKGFGAPLQIIHRWTFETPEDCIKSFDFTIASAAFFWKRDGNLLADMTPGGNWVSICDERFYADLAARRLIYRHPQRNEDGGGSMLRVLKFYQRGFRIPLDSLSAVMVRILRDMDFSGKMTSGDGKIDEEQAEKVITGLLREVDPNVDPKHIAHLPSESVNDFKRE